ncbi:MAG: hypothetical protein COB08_018415 [Rhodobacteraceae bacterium]|nr:hypothetical protein [Paracoccaceae bacterium]
MSKFINGVERVWDWPLSSRFANAIEQRKSLRSAADFGAVAGGVLGGGLSLAFAASDGAAITLSFSTVLLGFYGGSLYWKVCQKRKMTP